jgi:hypothetical protein
LGNPQELIHQQDLAVNGVNITNERIMQVFVRESMALRIAVAEGADLTKPLTDFMFTVYSLSARNGVDLDGAVMAKIQRERGGV